MRKKTFFKLIACVMLIAVAAVSLTACTFIKENDYRVANQTLVEINGAGGYKLTLTQNEVNDYFNTYAYYLVNSYGYTIREALDWVIENKVKSKYLITEGMGYLQNVTARKALISTNVKNPVDVLTPAERYAAIQSVNDSIETSIKTMMDESYQDELESIADKTDAKNVKEVVFADETLKYLKAEYLVNEKFDTDRVKIQFIYDDGKVSEAFIVPTTWYKTAFADTEAGTDKKIEIKFEEPVTEDGEVTYEEHILTHEYDVVEGRATKNEPEEEVDPDEIEINDVKVSRYDSVSTLKEKGATAEVINLEQKYKTLQSTEGADPAEVDAYRRLIENMKSGNKTMDYLYQTAYENYVLTALQAEVQKTAPAVTEAEVFAEFDYLYKSAKAGYTGDADKDTETFLSSIKSSLASMYYYPAIEDLSKTFYVYQILFKFSPEQEAWLKEQIGEGEDVNGLYELMKGQITTKESNPDYDPEFECPLHGDGDQNAECAHEGEGVCPALPYVTDGEGNVVERKFVDVYNELQTALQNAEQGDKLSIFEDYMYRFNDDPGVMNSELGYFIVPETMEDPNGFYDAFNQLARDIYADSATVGNAFVDGKLAYAFTPYGVHLIMISAMPFGAEAENTELTFADAAAKKAFLERPYNLAGDTLYQTLFDALKTEKQTNAYTDFSNSKIKADLMDDGAIVVKNEKKIKKLYELYGAEE